MDIRFQHAIAAARAGKASEARVLLDRYLKDAPGDADALFLMGTLSDTEEEKADFFEKVLAINPDHKGAASRLSQIVQELTPPPVDYEDDQSVETVIQLSETSEEEPEEVVVIEDTVVGTFGAEDTIVSEPGEMEEVSQPRDEHVSEPIPEWLQNARDLGEGAVSAEAETIISTSTEDAELPDWLQEEPAAEWEGDEVVEEVLDQSEVDLATETGQFETPDVDTQVEQREMAMDQDLELSEHQPVSRSSPNRGLEIILIILIILAVAVVSALVYLVANPPF